MAAPKGHQFWKLRAKSGYDPKFTDPAALWDKACEYFQWCDSTPLISVEIHGKDASRRNVPKMRAYTMGGLFIYLGVNHSYFSDAKVRLKKAIELKTRKAADKDNDRAMLDTIAAIEQIIFVQKFEGAAAGLLNHAIIARDLGLVEKQEQDQKVDSKQVITVRYANRNNTAATSPGAAEGA